jgi:endoglucanase
MTISDPTKERARDDGNRHEGRDDSPRTGRSIFTRSRKLTAIVVVWVLVLVSAVAFLLYRARSDESLTPTAALAAPGAPLTGRLYVDPNSQAAGWAQAHAGTAQAKLIQSRIADQPTAKWFGAWSGDITSAVSQYTGEAAAAGKAPVLVAYNLPGRDCGGQSAGGAASAQEYNAWIDGFAKGIDGRRALVILEPDALPMLDSCLDAAGQQARLDMLKRAVNRLESQNVWVYLDAGHSNWVPADEMARRLSAAGIAQAHGFSLNVSNYNPTDGEVAYGRQVDDALGTDKPFVIDTSRNGNGSRNGEWCNPAGSKLGSDPQAGGGAEMLLWLKAPGESDGDCGAGTGTAAGEFSPKLATDLINGS